MRATALRVSIVEDEPDFLAPLIMLLKQAFPNAAVRGYRSPTAILRRLAVPADVVITDYRLPGMDGIDLARRLCAAWPDARIILMSAYADSGLEARAAAEPGVTRFLHKGVDPEAFLQAVREARGGRAARDRWEVATWVSPDHATRRRRTRPTGTAGNAACACGRGCAVCRAAVR